MGFTLHVPGPSIFHKATTSINGGPPSRFPFTPTLSKITHPSIFRPDCLQPVGYHRGLCNDDSYGGGAGASRRASVGGRSGAQPSDGSSCENRVGGGGVVWVCLHGPFCLPSNPPRNGTNSKRTHTFGEFIGGVLSVTHFFPKEKVPRLPFSPSDTVPCLPKTYTWSLLLTV